jgi:hypothetical protein
MTVVGWARFDDGYTDNPKVRDAGPYAELLDMRAIIYCARYDTDGRITPSALTAIRHGIPRVAEKIDRLVTVGRWTTDPASGWQVHGFLEYNPSRASRAAMREGARERQARFRASRVGNGRVQLGEGTGIVKTKTTANVVARCETCRRLQIDCTC